ncbi:MAG: hypothetical protein HYT78_08315 [Deltaproteobacteria bacterium]|nr:hypothetical protein [Deltaproteobacteria bacterium]
MKSKAAAEYLNVDLEVRSRRDLKPLIDALFPELHTLYVGKLQGRFFASFEISTLKNSPDSAITEMVRAISKLPEPARRLWDHADDRVFDIGFEQQDGSRQLVWKLRNRTLFEVAKLRARIAVSLYPLAKRSVAPKPDGSRAASRRAGVGMSVQSS